MFEFKFNEIQENILIDNGDLYAILEEYQKYIRFIKGAIEFGEAENPLTTRIENGRLSFLFNGEETNYLANGKLYNQEIEVSQRLTMGDLAWVQRSNGDWELKRIK